MLMATIPLTCMQACPNQVGGALQYHLYDELQGMAATRDAKQAGPDHVRARPLQLCIFDDRRGQVLVTDITAMSMERS